MSFGSQNGWRVAAKHFERICKPRLLSDVNKSMLSRYRGELESSGLSSVSVRSYYRALHAGLGWAESVDLIGNVPTIRHRSRAKTSATMRSRVITTEEFERMLEFAKSERPNDHKEFSRFMQGLWYSSLRIDELNRLRWDAAAPLRVDLSGSLPLIVFLGAQKNHADTYLPAPPKFWAMIDKPGVFRGGPVFSVPGRYGIQMRTATIGRQILAAFSSR